MFGMRRVNFTCHQYSGLIDLNLTLRLDQYYSSAQSRWVHLDSCEAARDQPLLYDRGWGKKMSYIFAFSTDGAQDVSKGYIVDWEAALERRKQGSEEALDKVWSMCHHLCAIFTWLSLRGRLNLTGMLTDCLYIPVFCTGYPKEKGWTFIGYIAKAAERG